MDNHWKGLQDFLKEDSRLTRKITFNDHLDDKNHPNSNHSIKDVLNSYHKLCNKLIK